MVQEVADRRVRLTRLADESLQPSREKLFCKPIFIDHIEPGMINHVIVGQRDRVFLVSKVGQIT